jgi:hypothetical protein
MHRFGGETYGKMTLEDRLSWKDNIKMDVEK